MAEEQEKDDVEVVEKNERKETIVATKNTRASGQPLEIGGRYKVSVADARYLKAIGKAAAPDSPEAKAAQDAAKRAKKGRGRRGGNAAGGNQASGDGGQDGK